MSNITRGIMLPAEMVKKGHIQHREGPFHDLLFTEHGALQALGWTRPTIMWCLGCQWMVPACIAGLSTAAGWESSSLASFPSSIVYSEVSMQHQAIDNTADYFTSLFNQDERQGMSKWRFYTWERN